MIELTWYDAVLLGIMIILVSILSYRSGKRAKQEIVSEPVLLCQEVMTRACILAKKGEHEKLLQFLQEVTGNLAN